MLSRIVNCFEKNIPVKTYEPCVYMVLQARKKIDW